MVFTAFLKHLSIKHLSWYRKAMATINFLLIEEDSFRQQLEQSVSELRYYIVTFWSNLIIFLNVALFNHYHLHFAFFC